MTKIYNAQQQIYFEPLDLNQQAYYIANMNRILDAFEMHLESHPDSMFELWVKQWRAGVEGIHKTNGVEFK